MGKRLLLLNLTRLGDMLQSQPLIEDLSDSGHNVSLLCLENFAPALSLMRRVKKSYALPGAKLLADADSRWTDAVAGLLELAREIRENIRPDVVVNLTPTLPARLLAKLLAPTPSDILGFGLDAEGFGVNGGVWSSFLSGASARRVNTPFNIVDMFRRMGKALCTPETVGRAGVFVLEKPSGPALAAALELLRQPENGAGGAAREPRGYVGFQLGASEARRQWPVEYFVALGERLWEKARFCPILLGAKTEAKLAEDYGARTASLHVNAVGKTDLPELAALLSKCRLLVTNDTGTMHLAAGLGVHCLAFFLATAQPWDTGPYLTDCCCLEPALPCHPCAYNHVCANNNACLRRIRPETVGDMLLGYLESGRWPVPGLELRTQARVWLTGLTESGFAVLRCLSGHDDEDRSRWLAQQRHVWRHILDDLDGGGIAGDEGQELLPALSSAFRDEVVPALTQAADMLAVLSEQGRIADKSSLAGQLFLRNCDRLQRVLDACPPLCSLSHFWRELVQDRGGDLVETVRLTDLLAKHLARWAEVQQ
ncbi:MAG: glycosyltransferase family 9 protein [Desulfovibrio sp.]|jgi:ADP-heptose:LPS heptosyltransferase|nr:glycosyltransferase family 9 protein [Desulfovibrio sp.]